jgi:hypothetical protein
MTLGLVLPLVALATVLVGAPFALIGRRRTDGVLSALADAALLGFLAVTLVPALVSWWGPAPLVALGLAWVAALVLVVRRGRAALPTASMPRGRSRLLAGLATGLAVVAVALRAESVNFIPWVGDMGAYVNWGNQWARTGELTASWPPVMPAYLGTSTAVFGQEHAGSAMAISGLVLIIAIGRLLHLLGVSPWIVLGASALAALHPHAIWYSTFPSSESLNAPLFVLLIIIVLRVLSDAPTSVLQFSVLGLLMLDLGLLRGTGPLMLVPLGLLAVLALVVPDWKALRGPAWVALAAGTAGALLSYWYGITEIPRYYVEQQLRNLLPDAVVRAGDAARVWYPDPSTAIGLIVVVVAISVIAVLVVRRGAPTDVRATRVPGVLGVVLATVLALGMIATAVVGTATWFIIERMGIVLAALAIVAIVVVTRAADALLRGVVALLLGSTVALFYAAQTLRMGDHSDHAFFLYWDRYLVSEVLPALIVLVALLADRALQAWHAAPRDTGMLARVDRPGVRVAAGIVVGAVLVVPVVPTWVLLAQDTYMRGAHDLHVELRSASPDAQTPVVWTASRAGQYPGFFFPNTWMAFARPLQVSEGRLVVAPEGRKDFDLDAVADDDLLERALACAPEGEIVLYELRNGGPSAPERLDERFRFTEAAVHEGSMSLLSQPAREGWRHLDFTIDSWRVSSLEPLAAAACEVEASR